MMHLSKTRGVYPCGNISDTSSLKLLKTKGLIGHAFSLYSYWKSKSSDLLPFWSTWDFRSHWAHHRTLALFDRCAAPAKLPTWQCLRQRLTRHWGLNSRKWAMKLTSAQSNKKTMSSGISLLHCCSHLFYTSYVFSQRQTRVEKNRVFFPCWFCQTCSLGCGFTR